MKDITDRSIVVASRDQMSCDLSGESVILNLKNGIYYGLDPLAAFIWSTLKTPIAVSEIRERILAAYNVEPQKCEQDLISFLRKMAEEGLVKSES